MWSLSYIVLQTFKNVKTIPSSVAKKVLWLDLPVRLQIQPLILKLAFRSNLNHSK